MKTYLPPRRQDAKKGKGRFFSLRLPVRRTCLREGTHRQTQTDVFKFHVSGVHKYGRNHDEMKLKRS